MKKTENIAKLWIGTVLPEGVIDADVYRKYYNQQAKYDDKYLGTDGIYKHDAPTSPEYPNSQSTGIAIRPFTRISEILDASFEDESITEEGSIVPSQELLWELIASEKNIDGMIADKTLFCIYSISYNEKLFFLKPVLVKIVDYIPGSIGLENEVFLVIVEKPTDFGFIDYHWAPEEISYSFLGDMILDIWDQHKKAR